VHDHKKIEELQRENRALRRKIRMLEQQVSAVPEKPAETTGQYRAKNYFSYLLGCLREKSFFATAERAFKYFRNSLWVTRILKYGAIIYQYLQAGAFVLLYTAFFILIIPIFLAVTAVTLAIALILRKQNADRILSAAAPQIDIRIPKDKDTFEKDDRFAPQSDKNVTVLVVSPFFLRKNGHGARQNMYICARKEADGVYLVRKYFFFYLRRRLQKSGKFQIQETIIGE